MDSDVGTTINNGHLADNPTDATVRADLNTGQNEPRDNLTDRTESQSAELPEDNVRSDGGGRARSQADILIELAGSAQLFQTPDDKAFADLVINDHGKRGQSEASLFAAGWHAAF